MEFIGKIYRVEMPDGFIKYDVRGSNIILGLNLPESVLVSPEQENEHICDDECRSRGCKHKAEGEDERT